MSCIKYIFKTLVYCINSILKFCFKKYLIKSKYKYNEYNEYSEYYDDYDYDNKYDEYILPVYIKKTLIIDKNRKIKLMYQLVRVENTKDASFLIDNGPIYI